jgi:hypothetical protein
MKRRFLLAAAVGCLLLSLSVSTAVQMCSTLPHTGFTYATAKAHEHPTVVWQATGYYGGTRYVDDLTNNPDDVRYGNIVCVVEMDGEHAFFYEWWRDPSAGPKQARWGQAYPWQWVTVYYDPVCGLAFFVDDAFQ